MRVVLSEEPITADGDTVTIHVPPYRPAEAQTTGAAARRRTWLQIADLGRLAPLRIVSEGPSGAYAAGFLPALLGVPDSEVTPTGNELVET